MKVKNKTKTPYSSFQRNLHFTLKVCYFAKYVLILILGIITTVNGFLFIIIIHFSSIVKLTRTLDKPVPRLSVEYVSVFAVSLIVLLFFYKGDLVLFFFAVY